ncbi:MAG: hypothetical protein LQ344_007852 [Seirophora lacunosa]|nr:MAG: hypothetical protein LQ344_007852 [Seirophora lacunosa]
MAYRHAGIPPPGQYQNSQALDQPDYLRRNPSFNQGDDASYRANPNGAAQERAYRTRPYRASSNAGMQHNELFIGTANPTGQAPAYTSVTSSGGYVHQDTPVATSNMPPSYNPQHYGLTQAHSNHQIPYSGHNRYSAAYQPYVPAAYQQATPHSPPNYPSPTSNYYPSPPLPQYSSQTPPPPPPRQHEQRYTGRLPPQTGSSPPQNYGNEHYPPTPSSASSNRMAYTPPAPPPPPFPPGRDALPPNDIPQPYPSHRYSVSQTQQPFPDRQSSINHRLPPIPSRHTANGHAEVVTPPPRNIAYNRLNNSLPPTPGTPGPTPPAHSPQRANTNRHPHARPLPGPPQDTDYFSDQYINGYEDDTYDEEPGYEDLMKEVEAAVMGRAPSSSSQRSPRARRNQMHPSIDEGHEPHPLFEEGSTTTINPDTRHTHTNGQLGTLGAGQYINYDAYSNNSDAEAEAGLAAMHMADEQDAADEAHRHSSAEPRRSYGSRRSSTSQRNVHLAEQSYQEPSSDSDVAVDMDSYGGGFGGDLHYGSQPLSHHSSQSTRVDQDEQYRTPGRGSGSDLAGLPKGQYDYTMLGQGDIHPFPALGARVDTGGTGGLSEPGANPRRLSFEDGDEITLAESEGAQTSDTQSPSKEDMAEMFFHPGVNPSRPLPPAPSQQLEKNRPPHLMPAGTYRGAGGAGGMPHYDQYGRPTFPAAPDAYDQLLSPSGSAVPRSSSLISHSSSPQTVPPIRSKTDADRARILKQQQLAGIRTASGYGTDATLDSALSLPSADILGLPEIPVGKRRKFNPAKLSSSDFKKCSEPWALSSIVSWLREMSEGTADLKRSMVVDGIVALFTHKVPTMNIADAETLGARVVEAMFDAGTLLKEEEWVKFGEEMISGVLFQLTGTGCYSPNVHTQTLPGRCYAHHCMRTLKKINLQAQTLEPQRKVQDWATFYKISKETIEQTNKKEVERQNILHEIITTEDAYMDQLNVLRVLYRDELNKWQPPIIAPKRKDSFLNEVFGRADSIKQVNEDHLLAQLKYRQQEQGPWIAGFSDIFREWVRKARTAYIGYAEDFPKASSLVRQEADRNILFRQFLDQMREHERSKRLGWDTYLKSPITRLQRYGLLLGSVHKNMLQDSEEKSNLQTAIDEIKAVTLECDNKVAEQAKTVTLSELQSKLVLRAGMEKVKLNLTHLGREIILQGDLQRVGGSRFSWLGIHAILFDHYMVLAKTITQRDAAGGIKYEKYDVSKLPIPMDLLVLESTNDDPVVKSNIKGIGAVTRPNATAQDARNNRSSITNGPGPGTLTHVNTGGSVSSIGTPNSAKTFIPSTVVENTRETERLLYPFRIKHLGKSELYTLYASTAQNRQEWCEKIIEAKTRHAASLFRQNAEPFRLRVVADTAFAYDAMSGSAKSINIPGTPLDRAIKEVEARFAGQPRPNPICRASVNCATNFHQPYGNAMIAVGTDFGVYITNRDNPRGWFRAININRVTQLAVLEEFSLLILIADKSLIAYHLDSVCPVSANPPITANNNSTANNNHHPPRPSASQPQRPPQKLSGARDVSFFATGRMKDRTLVFYKKREGVSSIFKVLEPVYQKSTTSSSSSARSFSSARFGFSRKGNTEFFRDFDEFYIPSETYNINLFQNSLAIAAARGLEVMTLDKKVPFSIPDLRAPECASIKDRVAGQRPLGMFRLGDDEFLLVFEEVGIYVNKHGDVSRAVVMEFVGKAKQAALWGETYLVLVDQGGGFVEVRNAVNGRLRQVVGGRDVRLLDEGVGARGREGSVKVAMQHPESERGVVVVEMIVNEGLKE